MTKSKDWHFSPAKKSALLAASQTNTQFRLNEGPTSWKSTHSSWVHTLKLECLSYSLNTSLLMTPNLGLSFRHFSAPTCLNLNQVRQFTCDLPCWSPWGFDLHLKVHWHFKVQCFDKIVYVIKWNVVHTAMLNGREANLQDLRVMWAVEYQCNLIFPILFIYFILFFWLHCCIT